jgi:hypothetical protein
VRNVKQYPYDNWYLLSSEDVVLSVGQAWDSFARENDGAACLESRIVGTSLWDHVSCEETRIFLKQIFDNCRQTKRIHEMIYRCDSPELERVFLMRSFASDDGRLRVAHRAISVTSKTPKKILQVPEKFRCCTQCGERFDYDWLVGADDWLGLSSDTETFVCSACRISAESAMCR